MHEPELRSRRIPLGNTGRWLHVMECGLEDREAPTILTIHGAAGCWHNFYNQIRAFGGQYRIVAPDLRGHGLSPWPGPSTIGDFVDDLKWLVEAIVPVPFSIFSHSFGGCLATELAVQSGSSLQRMALLNTGGHIPRGFIYRTLQLFSCQTHLVRRYQPYAVSCSSEVAQYLLYQTLKGWNCWHLYPRITCPTLVVLGQRDVLIPASFAPRLQALLPASTVYVLQSAHVSMWEDPRVLFRRLQELMALPGGSSLAAEAN